MERKKNICSCTPFLFYMDSTQKYLHTYCYKMLIVIICFKEIAKLLSLRMNAFRFYKVKI
jgi:hypothetical protein